ncbi:MAG: hypothetical protein M1828_006841 [Chrysothrix sp. TS-e1954]|nr:MAG: hypothetical protein M1828_006841 [Chrysothrix sp. TS-e1954]
MELIESMCNRFASLEDSVNQRLSEETLHKTVAHALQSIAPTLDLSHGSDYLTNTTPHTHTAYPELSQRQGYATKREFLEQIDQSPSSRTESQPGHHRSSQQRDSTQNVWQDSMSKQTSCKEAGIDKELVGKDFLAGQLSIPSEHKTGAHKLLIHWQAIKPFYRTLVDPYYVTREEKTRGVLRIWGRGEGHDRSTRLPNRGASALSPSVRSDHESVSSSTSTDGSWGKGFDAGTGPQIRRGLEDCIGGLGPDDSLVLDGASVCKLRDNYFQNIHVMHPILDKQDMYRLIDDFIATYGGNPRSELSNSGSPGSTTFLKGPKRKRSGDLAADMDRTSNSSQAGRNVVEHSPENALILLVLALGKICEHRQNLPAAVSDMGPPEAAHSPRYGESPSHAFRSPHVTSTPSSAAATKLDGGNVSPRKMSRTSSEAGNPGPRRALRNIDRIPGLAYFAYATEILGEINGTMSLVYVQSCILAGLYKGQLARVMESWKWIYEACMNWLLLVKGEVNLETTHIETALGHKTREEADSLRMTYWTCLQLERYDKLLSMTQETLPDDLQNSDILAEFDFLPHSAISQFEDQMDHPQGPALRSQDPEDTLIMLYYCAQIALRKLLNRAHSALYNSQKGKMPNPGWSITNSDDLAIALQEWKEHLPSPLQWSEDDDPASHINAARLRGKYYGARYIIHRPFLHHALQKELGIDTPFDRELGLPENRRIVDMSQKSVRAAIKSTIAFDGLYGRPIITNPFGTAQAQFGNMLVLAATKASQTHGWLVSQDDLTPLFERTFRFLGRLTPHSKTMRINVRILENAKAELDRLKDDHDKKQIHQHDTFSAANSFGSNRS